MGQLQTVIARGLIALCFSLLVQQALASSGAHNETTACTELFHLGPEKAMEQAKKFKDSKVKSAINQLEAIKSGLPAGFYHDALNILGNFEWPIQQGKLVALLKKLSSKNTEVMTEKLQLLMEERLQPFFTRQQARTKVKGYFDGKKTLSEALGTLNLKQLQKHVYGTDPKKPSSHSLISRFVAEYTEVTGSAPDSATRAFFKTPDDEGNSKGPVRLNIAVMSENDDAFAVIKKYFFNEHFLIHTRQSRQGTLYVSFEGQSYGYAGASQGGDTRDQGGGADWPIILLSSAEAERLHLYFKLGAKDQDAAKIPWNLPGEGSSKYLEGFGGYTCCTHWFGEMPIGEQLVDHYSFPGSADDHAYNQHLGKGIQSLKIGSLSPRAAGQPWTSLVWKNHQGNAQFWQMMGLKTSLKNAELTNPGYIFYALVGKASIERVPLVLSFVHENKLPDLETIRSNTSYY